MPTSWINGASDQIIIKKKNTGACDVIEAMNMLCARAYCTALCVLYMPCPLFMNIGHSDLHVYIFYKSQRGWRAIESELGSEGWQPGKPRRQHRQWRDITQWYGTVLKLSCTCTCVCVAELSLGKAHALEYMRTKIKNSDLVKIIINILNNHAVYTGV